MKSTSEPRTDAPAEDVGAWLRERREQAGRSLREIADSTKLPLRTLDALERNRASQLPGGIYGRSIVRAYAREIGLDPELALRRFLAEHPQDPDTLPHAPTPSAPVRKRSGVWSVLRTVISVIGALIPVAAGIFYFATSVLGSDAPEPPVDEMPHIVRAVAPLDAVTRPRVGAAEPLLPFMISVSASCRLQIVADGREVLARRVEAGEWVRLDVASDVVLMGDDASAVHVSINGRAGRAFGEAGAPLGVRISRENHQAWLIQP